MWIWHCPNSNGKWRMESGFKLVKFIKMKICFIILL